MIRKAKGRWLRRTVIILALVEAGWLAFDGGHALIVGDYVTPSSGEYAGQLGPWADAVSAIGLEPRSRLVKSIHLVLGLGWIGFAISFVLGLRGTWTGMLLCAILGLWYLPFGTLLSTVQITLLLLPTVRGVRSRIDA